MNSDKTLYLRISMKVFFISLNPSATASSVVEYSVGLGISGSGVFRNIGMENPNHHKALVTKTKHWTSGFSNPNFSPTARWNVSSMQPPRNP